MSMGDKLLIAWLTINLIVILLAAIRYYNRPD